jgi:septin family protein
MFERESVSQENRVGLHALKHKGSKRTITVDQVGRTCNSRVGDSRVHALLYFISPT